MFHVVVTNIIIDHRLRLHTSIPAMMIIIIIIIYNDNNNNNLIMTTASTGKSPFAVSPDNITQSVPSNTAFDFVVITKTKSKISQIIIILYL